MRIGAKAPVEPDDEGVAGRPLERICIVVHGDANPPHGSTEVRVKKRADVLDDFVPASATAGADWRHGVEPVVHPERSPTLAPNPLRGGVGATIVALPYERSRPHSTRGSRRGERDGEASGDGTGKREGDWVQANGGAGASADSACAGAVGAPERQRSGSAGPDPGHEQRSI